MKDLFLEFLHKQPSGKVYFGGCSKEDKNDGGGGGGGGTGKLTIRSRQEYAISPEKRAFVATYSEKTGIGENNQGLINQHLSYLRSLMDEGKLLFAGAYVSGDRGCLVISASSIDEAAMIINKDPLFKAEYYGKSDIEE
ncbi:YciI family protein, partial [Bacillus toyonensis]|uniref:YciI family protein n=1 Tax=Bacillus toyonensis TaxID=155322 RepID=UPI000BFAD4A4